MQLSQFAQQEGQSISDAITAIANAPSTPAAAQPALLAVAQQARYSSTAQVALVEAILGEDPEVPGT